MGPDCTWSAKLLEIFLQAYCKEPEYVAFHEVVTKVEARMLHESRSTWICHNGRIAMFRHHAVAKQSLVGALDLSGTAPMSRGKRH